MHPGPHRTLRAAEHFSPLEDAMKLCSCGLPMLAAGKRIFCAHCDSGRVHVTSLCTRCAKLMPRTPRP